LKGKLKNRLKKYLSFLPGTLWALFILVLTGLPGDFFPEVTSFWDWLEPDKAIHLLMFGIFAFLIMWGHRMPYRDTSRRVRIFVIALILGEIYAGLTEILQDVLFVGRDGNVFDFMANTVGVLLGIGLFHLLYKNRINATKSM
jgi:VanZ family protein